MKGKAQASKPKRAPKKRGTAPVVAARPARKPRPDAIPGEEIYRLLVESIRDYGVFMLDLHGRVQTWSPGAERITGYRRNEILGRHFSTFYPPEDVEAGKPLRELKEAVAAGRLEDEGWRVRKDGTRYWSNVVVTPLRDSAGTLRGFTKVTRDMTERRKLEENLRTQNALLGALIEGNPLGILFVDANGEAQLYNPAFARMFQLAPESIVGQAVQRAIEVPGAASEWAAVAPQLERGESFHLRTVRRRSDGSVLPVDLVGVPVFDAAGKLAGAYSIYRDITEEVRHEEALLESRESLRRLSAHALRSQDAQRQRVARDLHDMTSPAFASLLSKLHQLRQRGADRDLSEAAILGDAIALAESLSREIRNVAHELHPMLLDEQGLAAALRGYLAALGRRKGRDIHSNLSDPPARPPREVELVLFRMVEESLEAAMGAAGSVAAQVRLGFEGDELVLEILDPGRQVSHDAIRHWAAGGVSEMSVGLAALRERFHQLGGRLQIEAAPAGLLVRAYWPLRREVA